MKIDPDLCLEVPDGFDDTDADSQVHPMGRKLFFATTAAGAFGKAQAWIAEHDIRLADVSWDHMYDEDEPYMLGIYFTFELDSEDD